MDISDKALDVMPRKLKSMMAKLKRLLDDKKKDEVPAYDYRYDVADLRLDIAWELFEMGRYNEALSFYRKVTWSEGGGRKYVGTACVLTELHRFEEAMAVLQKGLKEDPDSAALFHAMGNYFQEKMDFNSSYNWFRRAMEANPKEPMHWFSVANAACCLSQYEEGISIYRKLVNKYPRNGLYREFLGWSLSDTGCTEEAMREYKTAIQLKGADIDAYIGLYFVCRDLGLQTEALNAALSGYRLFPGKDPDMYAVLTEAYRDQGWIDEAIGIIQKGLELFPDDEQLQDMLKDMQDDDDGGEAVETTNKKLVAIIVNKRQKMR
jgi:tetratricopeptide (TPR) repeat protein